MTSVQAARASFVLAAKANILAGQSSEFLAKFADDSVVTSEVTVNETRRESSFDKQLFARNEREFFNTLQTVNSLAIAFTLGEDESVSVDAHQLSTYSYKREKQGLVADKQQKMVVNTRVRENWQIGETGGSLTAKKLRVEQTDKVGKATVKFGSYADAARKCASKEEFCTRFWRGHVEIKDVIALTAAEGKEIDPAGIKPEHAALVLNFWSGVCARDPAAIAATLADNINGALEVDGIQYDLNKQEMVEASEKLLSTSKQMNILALQIFKSKEGILSVDYLLDVTKEGATGEYISSYHGTQRWMVQENDGNIRLSTYIDERTIIGRPPQAKEQVIEHSNLPEEPAGLETPSVVSEVMIMQSDVPEDQPVIEGPQQAIVEDATNDPAPLINMDESFVHINLGAAPSASATAPAEAQVAAAASTTQDAAPQEGWAWWTARKVFTLGLT